MVKGFIFIVSCAYYRSSWKYKNRSLRYCFLDSGHHLGAIEAAANLYRRDVRVLFNFDKIALNQDLGLENKEFITAAVISGNLKAKSVRKLRSPLPFVAPTDYFETNSFVEAGYRNTVVNKYIENNWSKSSEITKSNLNLSLNIDIDKLSETIFTRRSARAFTGSSILLSEWQQIWHYLQQPLNTVDNEQIAFYLVVNSIEGIESGLYRGNQLLKSGDFGDRAKYLCVNQALAKNSAVTLFLTATYNNYQTAMQCAGWLGQRLYLIGNYLGIGCSGIGAYYDDETQKFLKTDKDILYAMAIGR